MLFSSWPSSGLRLAMVTIVVFFVPYYSITTVSINSLQLSLSFAIVLHYPPTLILLKSKTPTGHHALVRISEVTHLPSVWDLLLPLA